MFIDVNLRGQELTTSDIILAEGSLNKLFLRVTADSEWDGLSLRFVFRNVNATGSIEREVIASDLSAVPVAPECIRVGHLFITAVGVADGGATRLTTADMPFGKKISPVAALMATAPDAITPTQFEQMLSLIGSVSNLDTEAKNVCDAVNEVLAGVGSVSNLDTDDVQLVAAVNRIAGWIRQLFEGNTTSNLIDPNGITASALLTYTNGSLNIGSSYSYYFTTDFIPCLPGQILRLQMDTNDGRKDATEFESAASNNSITAVCAYNADKAYISGVSRAKEYIIPEGSAYIRVSLYYDSANYWDKMLFFSSDTSVIPYVEYGQAGFKSLRPEFLPHQDIDFSKVIEQGPGTSADKVLSQAAVSKLFDCDFTHNLIDPEAVTSSSLLSYSNGKLNEGSSYSGYWTTGFIPCTAGDVVRFQFDVAATGIRYDSTDLDGSASTVMTAICAYTKSHTFLAGASKVQEYVVPEGAAFIRISCVASNNYINRKIFFSEDRTVVPYSEYGETTFLHLKPQYIPKSAPLVFLPQEICVAVGRTIEIYNAQVCPNVDKYHVRWICNVGNAMKRKFSIEGLESLIGEHQLTLELYDDALTMVAHASTTIKIVASDITDELQFCTIGDSLTNGKPWLQELRALSGGKISHIGTRGISEGLKHEGRSGFKASDYLTAQKYDFEGEGVHAFWDTNEAKFSWSYYKNSTGINPDAVQLFLGTNDLAGGANPDAVAADIKALVDTIRADEGDIPIFVVFTICWGNQDGIGCQTSNDGFASQKGRWKYQLDYQTISLAKALQDVLKEYNSVYFVPLTQCHDSEFNFGAVEVPVNPRALQTEFVPAEGVHPQQQGYEQMADVMWSVICAKL